MKYATHALLILILLLTMFNNLEHIAQVYHLQVEGTSHNSLYEWIESYSVVITFDLLVIALIIAGKVTESVTVAWLIFALNLIFFNGIGKGYDVYATFGTPHVFILALNAFVSTVIFSGLFAWSIHKLPILFKERLANNKEREFYELELKNENSKLIQQRAENLALIAENKAHEEHIKALERELNTENALLHVYNKKTNDFQKLFTCDSCQSFTVDPLEKGLESSIKALRAHTGVCKKQPKNIQS